MARLGGDEFTAICIDIPDRFIEKVQARIRKHLEEWNRTMGKEYTLAISIGALKFGPDNQESLEELMRQADELLYKEKKGKKGKQIGK